MQRREIASIIFAVAAFPVDYLVYTMLPSISTIAIAIATIVLLAIATVIWFSGKKEEGRKPDPTTISVEVTLPNLVVPKPPAKSAKKTLTTVPVRQGTVVLNLEPLPHYRGYTLPPNRIKLLPGVPLALQGVDKQKAAPREYSHPNGRFLAESQFMTRYYIPPFRFSATALLIAKFGVIRVHSLVGDAIKCKAEIRLRVVETKGKVVGDDWHSIGFANWYSPELSQKFSLSAIDDIRAGKLRELRLALGRGINSYLFNKEEDITQGQHKDLLLFYMLKDNPSVFMCTSLDYAPTGIVQNGHPVKFEVELTLSGQGYSASIWNYRVTALWDDYTIVKV
jgi:hypothetical protein